MRVGLGRVAAGLGLIAGCIESIPLGTECPEQYAHCTDAPRTNAADRANDATPKNERDAGSLDAAVALDAGTTSPPPPPPPPQALDASTPEPLDAGNTGVLFPPLRNGTFQLTRGRVGMLGIEPIEHFSRGGVEPWSACGLGLSVLESASPVRGSPEQTVVPTDGQHFIESELLITARAGITQALPAPLERGRRYAFRIDVQASDRAEVVLDVVGATNTCMPATRLATIDDVPAREWASRCVTFTAPKDVDIRHIMLVPSTPGREIIHLEGARLFFDNLREDPRCADQRVRERQ